ncbi:hypothetical protein Tco_0243077 [Tanacetum coccineum]
MRTSKYGKSNASALEDPTFRAGNPVKEILLKLNLFDHRQENRPLNDLPAEFSRDHTRSKHNEVNATNKNLSTNVHNRKTAHFLPTVMSKEASSSRNTKRRSISASKRTLRNRNHPPVNSQTVGPNPERKQEEGHHPCFLQLYIYDTQDELNNRMHHFGGPNEGTLNPEIVEGLIHVLDEHNGLVQLFRTARDRCNDGEIPGAQATPKAHLPYGMFLTRLFRHVMELYPHLDNGIYDVVEQVMCPLALRQTRRPRSDRHKARHSVSSTSAHHNCGSLSHQGDDDEDDGASRASTPCPTTYLNSLKPLDYQQYEVPTSSEQNDDFLFERQTDLLNQTQQMHKELKGGFKLFGKTL